MTIHARGLHLLAYNIRPRLAGDRLVITALESNWLIRLLLLFGANFFKRHMSAINDDVERRIRAERITIQAGRSEYCAVSAQAN